MNYCIYKHTNLINNKVYIGYTKSTTRRWRHNGVEYKPNKNENQNRPFWNAIQKYGWENFKHEVLLSNLSFREACLKEKEYIKMYNSTEDEFGYNVSHGGNGGLIYTEHPRGMLGKKHKKSFGINKSKELRDNNPMLNGKVIWGKTHDHPRGMKGKTHSKEFKENLSNRMRGRKLTESNKAKLIQCNRNRTRKVIQLRDNGVFLNEFNSIKEAGMQTGIHESNIGKVCRNQHQRAGGFRWMYEEDYKKYIAQELNSHERGVSCNNENKILN